MKLVWSTSLLAGMILWCAGDMLALAEVKSDASMEALRWAKQAEASGVARDQARFVEEIDRALQVALDAGAKTPNHRLGTWPARQPGGGA
jgi:hypothetical protein